MAYIPDVDPRPARRARTDHPRTRAGRAGLRPDSPGPQDPPRRSDRRGGGHRRSSPSPPCWCGDRTAPSSTCCTCSTQHPHPAAGALAPLAGRDDLWCTVALQPLLNITGFTSLPLADGSGEVRRAPSGHEVLVGPADGCRTRPGTAWWGSASRAPGCPSYPSTKPASPTGPRRSRSASCWPGTIGSSGGTTEPTMTGRAPARWCARWRWG